jgi:hypothetical protein
MARRPSAKMARLATVLMEYSFGTAYDGEEEERQDARETPRTPIEKGADLLHPPNPLEISPI